MTYILMVYMVMAHIVMAIHSYLQNVEHNRGAPHYVIYSYDLPSFMARLWPAQLWPI